MTDWLAANRQRDRSPFRSWVPDKGNGVTEEGRGPEKEGTFESDVYFNYVGYFRRAIKYNAIK